MGQSLGGYRAAVRAALGEIPVDAYSTDVLDQDINASYFEVLRLFEHVELHRDDSIATVSGTKEYALPADYWWMRVVRDETNELSLIHKSLAYIQEREFLVSGTIGQPKFWTHEDQNIMLHETPDGVYTIRVWYFFRPALLAKVNDRDVLPAEWTEIISKGAIYRAFETVGEYDRGVHQFNRQRVLLNRIAEVPALERALGQSNIGPESRTVQVTH